MPVIALRPVRLETLRHLLDLVGLLHDHAVVARQREILFAEVERRDERRLPVHHDRFLVGHVKFWARPLDVHSRVFEELKCCIVRAVAAGTFRVEHNPDRDAGVLAFDHRLHQLRLAERELLDEKARVGEPDEIEDRSNPVVRLHDQMWNRNKHA